MRRKVFDCIAYNGELDVLEIRLHELAPVVDYFVIVEADVTFSGKPKALAFDVTDSRLTEFAAKIRYIYASDAPTAPNPWVREYWQRDAVLRGTTDAHPHDLVLVSDVDEVPRALFVQEAVEDWDHRVFGFDLATYYFFANYRNISGPESSYPCTFGATLSEFDSTSPTALRHRVRSRQVAARIFENGGWHFSYLMDDEAIRRKIRAFSHQEHNRPDFLAGINVEQIVAKRQDLFGRGDFKWDIVGTEDLPAWIRDDRERVRELCAPAR